MKLTEEDKEDIEDILLDYVNKHFKRNEKFFDKYSIPLENFHKRMEEIESMIRAHAFGVQNVYQKFEDLQETLTAKPKRKKRKTV